MVLRCPYTPYIPPFPSQNKLELAFPHPSLYLNKCALVSQPLYLNNLVLAPLALKAKPSQPSQPSTRAEQAKLSQPSRASQAMPARPAEPSQAKPSQAKPCWPGQPSRAKPSVTLFGLNGYHAIIHDATSFHRNFDLNPMKCSRTCRTQTKLVRERRPQPMFTITYDLDIEFGLCYVATCYT